MEEIPVKRPRSQRNREPGKPVCFDCELATKCKVNCLPGLGRKNGIMIVGEKPGFKDHVIFEPFNELDGDKLGYLLEQVQLTRDDVYLTHAVKCGPPKPNTRLKKFALACKPHLIEEIAWVRPKVIVAMGSTPFSVLMGEDLSAADYRGFPIPLLDSQGNHLSWVLPTHSITAAIGKAANDPVIVRDLKLARSIAKEGYEPKPLDVRVRVVTSLKDLKEAVIALRSAESFSFDLETKDLDFQRSPILCAAFSIDGKLAYVIPVDQKFSDRGEFRTWTAKERGHVIWALKAIFNSPARKTAQNGKFDLKFLRTYGIHVRNFDFDTMLAHHLCDESKPHDLLFIAQQCGIVDEKYDRALEDQKRFHGKDDWTKFDPDTLYHYAGIDAAVTQQLRPILEDWMIRTKTINVFKKVSVPLTYLLADMEFRGAHIDLAGMHKRIDETNEKIAEAQAKLNGLLEVSDFNPNSTKQLKLFFKKNRVRAEKMTKSGEPSVDEEELKRVMNMPKYKDTKVAEVASAVLQMRGLTKLKGTYLDGTKKGKKTGLRHKLDENHFLHTEFLIHGTYTGRLSSKNPNLQNIPKDDGIRQLFTPDTKKDILMSVDYKQLEVRVAAGVSRDRILIQEILSGVDMHSRNAAEFLMGVKERDFIKIIKDENNELHSLYSRKRSTAKGVTFGVLYGSSAHGVSKRNNIPLDDCEHFIKKFFRKYESLYGYIQEQHRRVFETYKVKTPTGRFTKFHDLEWANSRWCPREMRFRQRGEAQRIAVNMPIQGYGSDIFQSHKLDLFRYLNKNKMKSRLILSLHDGFVLNVKPEERAELEEVVPKIMYAVLNPGTRYEVPVEVDIEFANCWEGKD